MTSQNTDAETGIAGRSDVSISDMINNVIGTETTLSRNPESFQVNGSRGSICARGAASHQVTLKHGLRCEPSG